MPPTLIILCNCTANLGSSARNPSNNPSGPTLSNTVLTTVPHQLHSAIFLQPSRPQQLPLCELRQPLSASHWPCVTPDGSASALGCPASALRPSASATLASLRLCAAPKFLCVASAGSVSHFLAFALLENSFCHLETIVSYCNCFARLMSLSPPVICNHALIPCRRF